MSSIRIGCGAALVGTALGYFGSRMFGTYMCYTKTKEAESAVMAEIKHKNLLNKVLYPKASDFTVREIILKYHPDRDTWYKADSLKDLHFYDYRHQSQADKIHELVMDICYWDSFAYLDKCGRPYRERAIELEKSYEAQMVGAIKKSELDKRRFS